MIFQERCERQVERSDFKFDFKRTFVTNSKSNFSSLNFK